MNITNDTFYNSDDFAQIIARNVNKTLFLIYKHNKNSSYNLENISFHNFTTTDNFYKQIIKTIKYIYSSKYTFELSKYNNQINIKLFGFIIEITNIPNFNLIKEEELIKYIDENY